MPKNTDPPPIESPQPAPLDLPEPRHPQASLLPWRWWWNTSLILIIALCILQYWTEQNWDLLPRPMNVVVGSIMITLWLSLAAWIFIAVPYLCARDQTPRFRAPPLTCFVALRFLVWTPALLIAGTFLFELVYFSALQYFRTGMFRIRLPSWFFIPVLILLAIAIWYGRSMARLLKVRIQAQAAQARHCFECGYPLHSLASCRCPECGESFVPTSPPPPPLSQ